MDFTNHFDLIKSRRDTSLGMIEKRKKVPIHIKRDQLASKGRIQKGGPGSGRHKEYFDKLKDSHDNESAFVDVDRAHNEWKDSVDIEEREAKIEAERRTERKDLLKEIESLRGRISNFDHIKRSHFNHGTNLPKEKIKEFKEIEEALSLANSRLEELNKKIIDKP